MVVVQFNSQPFADGRDLRDFFADLALNTDLTRLRVVVAWAKRSGLARLRPSLEAIRANGVDMQLIVGIDEGGATRQGLELALQLFDQVHVFHDRRGRTFHPKVFLAAGDSGAQLLVGSHNLTAGGVYFNYEAAIECELELPADAPLLASVDKFIDRLYADSAACKPLDDPLLLELLANPRYRIADEDARARPARSTDEPEEIDARTDVEGEQVPEGSAPSVFGPSTEPKRSDPGMAGPAKKATPAKKAAASKAVAKKAAATPAKKASTPPTTPSPTQATVAKRWFKRLPNSDAQQPQSGNPTGALRLTKAGFDINWQTYFRYDFFAPAAWQSTQSTHGQPLEFAMVPFDVEIDGQAMGQHTLRVDHAPHREQGQGNVPTDLKWGTLSPTLLATDYHDYWVVIERLSDGSYKLRITQTNPGEAAFIG